MTLRMSWRVGDAGSPTIRCDLIHESVLSIQSKACHVLLDNADSAWPEVRHMWPYENHEC